jgi:hypothetical protein
MNLEISDETVDRFYAAYSLVSVRLCAVDPFMSVDLEAGNLESVTLLRSVHLSVRAVHLPNIRRNQKS